MTENGTFMPPEYTEYKENVADLLAYIPDAHFMEGPIGLRCLFLPKKSVVRVYERPDTWERWGNADLDNLVGTVMDAMQGVVFENDKQVVDINAQIARTGQ